MADQTECQTPGAHFSIQVSNREIKASVQLPITLDLDEDEAKLLETNIHNVLELVLARYFEISFD